MTNFFVNEMSDDENIRLRNVRLYPELCKALDRCKISSRGGCLIVNAVLKDFNLLTPQTSIDPANICRQRIFLAG